MDLERTADWMLAILSTNGKRRGEFQRKPMWVTPPPPTPVLQKTGCEIQMQKWSVRSTDEAQCQCSMPNCTLRFSGKFRHEGYCPRLTRTVLTLTEQEAGRLSYLQADLAKNWRSRQRYKPLSLHISLSTGRHLLGV